jgi:anti-sigma B factor antagonist
MDFDVIDARVAVRHSWSIVTIERTQVGSKVVLHVAGRMDAENAVQFEDQCESCISDGFTSIVVDLGNLKYVSSMGLGAIVRIAKQLRDKGGELRICCLTGLVRQLFEITRLNHVFPAHDSVESALMEG